MNLRTPGIFSLTDSMTGSEIAALVRKVESALEALAPG